jgi:signal transduction histidine kinase
VLRRHLFWKLYATLLASLVIVGLLLGLVWRVTGERVWQRWSAFRIHLSDVILPERDAPPGRLARVIADVGEKVGADISLYAPDRALLAAHGEVIDLPPGDDDIPTRRMHHVIRLDLPDGRTVLARLRPPPPEPGMRILMFVLLVAGSVGIAAYPVTRRLTRRLETLKCGVETWGTGSLATRVAVEGRDEVAEVAQSFNVAAARIEALMGAQKALLANASHELRSPLARLRMAVEMWAENPTGAARDEIARNLGEIDQLVDEILLASRLDHDGALDAGIATPVDLLGLSAEEAARVGATAEGEAVEMAGDQVLLRRMIRNLLDNAVKHGAPPVEIVVARKDGSAVITVMDRGGGIPPGERERVFAPFYRPHGRSEASGGWGLGLALVAQIVRRHDGRVECVGRDGGGTMFRIELPLLRQPALGAQSVRQVGSTEPAERAGSA